MKVINSAAAKNPGIKKFYKNLVSKCWSIQDKKTGLIDRHADSIYLENFSRFFVSKKSQLRARNIKRNVHAWIEGEICDNPVLENTFSIEIYYNPHVNDHFQFRDGKELVDISTDDLKQLKYIKFTKAGTCIGLFNA